MRDQRRGEGKVEYTTNPCRCRTTCSSCAGCCRARAGRQRSSYICQRQYTEIFSMHDEALAGVIMNIIPQPGPLGLLEAMPMQAFIPAAWTCEDIDENTAPIWNLGLPIFPSGVFALHKHICRAQASRYLTYCRSST
jgi:hypothetical protein